MKLLGKFDTQRIAFGVLTAVALLVSCGSESAENDSNPEGADNSDNSDGDSGADTSASGPCSDGERRCDGDSLEACEGETWSVVEQCATAGLCTDTAQLCEVAAAACPEGCLPPACEVDETSCVGSLVQICNDKRSGFDTLEDCGPACGGSHCSAGACRPDVCAIPGLFLQNVGDAMDRPATCSDDCSTITVRD